MSRFWAAHVLAAPGGAQLLLRAFLGLTFVFAGSQKLANPNFFSATAPGSFQEQLRGSIITSPLHHFLAFALHAPVLIAVLIAFGEIAVGLGTLLGLFGRLAATGGVLLSLSFFLTVSFRDNPYYYGPDIVFLFVWTPFVLGGPGTWSVDHISARRAERVRETLEVNAQRGPGTRQSVAARQRAAAAERRISFRRRARRAASPWWGWSLAGSPQALGGLSARLNAPARSARSQKASRGSRARLFLAAPYRRGTGQGRPHRACPGQARSLGVCRGQARPRPPGVRAVLPRLRRGRRSGPQPTCLSEAQPASPIRPSRSPP